MIMTQWHLEESLRWSWSICPKKKIAHVIRAIVDDFLPIRNAPYIAVFTLRWSHLETKPPPGYTNLPNFLVKEFADHYTMIDPTFCEKIGVP